MTTELSEQNYFIEKLKEEIETAVGYRIVVPNDFERLRESIFARISVYISSTTLKRLWGYLNEDVKTRVSTFNHLSRYLGYKDYDDFMKKCDDKLESGSNPVLSRRINVPEDLAPGDRLLLTWLPDRKCLVEYLGDGNFKVIESVATRLMAGDTFSCTMIIEGEPLYLGNLRQSGSKTSVAYVCGKNNGVRYELTGGGREKNKF